MASAQPEESPPGRSHARSGAAVRPLAAESKDAGEAHPSLGFVGELRHLDGADAEGGCATALVTFDNERSDCATVISLSCVDYPGLMRTTAWVLRGLDLRIEHCILDTADGNAEDTFWVTGLDKQKLSDDEAAMVCDRLGGFVSQCFPPTSASFRTMTHENVIIDNGLDDEASVMVIGVGTSDTLYLPGTGYASDGYVGPLEGLRIEDVSPDQLQRVENSGHVCRPRDDVDIVLNAFGGVDPAMFLLDAASAVTGAGLTVSKAIMLDWSGCDKRTREMVQGVCGGKAKVFKLWLKDAQGRKLDYSSASAVLFTMDLVIRSGSMATAASTTAPGASAGMGITVR